VFGDLSDLSPEAVKALWSEIKDSEKRERAIARAAPESAKTLAGVPSNLPALTRALKLQQKAGRVGFDWNNARAVIEKLREETDEVEAEIAAGNKTAAAEEVGDLLFALANLARHLEVDPEAALRGANAKFERRFSHIEGRLAEANRKPEGATLDEMEALWAEAKAEEKARA
jgi:ATP diphosphatase